MLSNKPKLSVILPAYNAEKFISDAITSILNQTFSDFELIIADDGSLDNTKNIIDSFVDERISCFHNNSNIGKVDTVNKLVEFVKGKYITVHDADDVSLPKRFEKQIAFLENESDFKLVGCSFFNFHGNHKILVEMPTSYDEIKKGLPEISQFHGPTVVFNSDILSEVGGLYRYFTWGEDIDFTARVVEKYMATNISEPLYIYRVHKESLTKSLKVVTPDRLINKAIRCYLANQRKETGTDLLIDEKYDELDQLKEELLRPYKTEAGLLYWKLSQKMFHNRMKGVALKAALIAFYKQPTYKYAKNFFVLVYKIFF